MIKEKPFTKTKFISLSASIARQERNPRFKKAFTEEMSRLRLAHELKTLRQTKRLTQAQVAARAEMPQSVVARIESGSHNYSIATLHKIARVFEKQVGLVK